MADYSYSGSYNTDGGADSEFSGNSIINPGTPDYAFSGNELLPRITDWGILQGDNIILGTSGDVVTITGESSFGISAGDNITLGTSGDVVTITGESSFGIADGTNTSVGTTGEVVSITANNIQLSDLNQNCQDTFRFFDGATLDSAVVTVASDGATITCSVEKTGGGNVRVMFSSGIYDWVTAPDTVALTPGSDTSPQINYIYLLESNKTLTASTASFPSSSTEYAPIATVLCQSAASAQTDGLYKVHAWTDHITSIGNNGHLSHLNYWIRQQNASWTSGASLTPTVGAATFDIATSSGVILQLHSHAFPAFDTSTGSEVMIVNDSSTAYKRVGDLTGETTDANGDSLNNKHYNLVVWGVVSEASGDCQLMVNLPTGSYNSSLGSIDDINRTSVYTIPTDFIGVGFLIARLSVQYNAGSNTFVLNQNEDLRGLFPATGAGGGATGGQSEFSDNAFIIYNNADDTRDLTFDCSGISTATTRVVTARDEDHVIGKDWAVLAGDNITLGTSGDVVTITGEPDLGILEGNNIILGTSGDVVTINTENPINFIANSHFETAITGWSAYADAAGTEPVDGSGGSPTTTVTRTASTPLRGTGSGLITKDAADRQGEGASYDFTIDEADKNKVLSISMDFVASANFVTEDITLHIYDKDNTSLIQVRDINFDTVANRINTTFNATDADDYRLILHIATTNANAYTLKFDNVQIGPEQVILAPAMSDWIDAGTITIDAVTTAPTKGVVVTDTVKYRRVGDSAQIKYEYYQSSGGVAGSGAYLFKLPDGLVADTSKIITYNGVAITDRFIYPIGVAGWGGVNSTQVLCNPRLYSDTEILLVGLNSSVEAYVGSAFDSLVGDVRIAITVTVPIAGWSTNVVSSESRTFKISHYLAGGTRVTGAAPTKLGEYRSYLRNASAHTYTETNGDPSTAPTVADGIQHYTSSSYTSADTNNNPSRFDIFVGKNKHIKWEFYASSGRTGFIDTSVTYNSTTAVGQGLLKSYDPTTGLASIINKVDVNAGGDGVSVVQAAISDCYFDIIVSDNALAVQSERLVGEHEIFLTGLNGRGSSNTAIRRYTAEVKNIGDAITYADSATLGATFTINESGVYTMSSVFGLVSATGRNFGISLNSTQLTTDILSITASDRIALSTAIGISGVSEASHSCSVTLNLEPGDVLRSHSAISDQNGSSNTGSFRITKVAN